MSWQVQLIVFFRLFFADFNQFIYPSNVSLFVISFRSSMSMVCLHLPRSPTHLMNIRVAPIILRKNCGDLPVLAKRTF